MPSRRWLRWLVAAAFLAGALVAVAVILLGRGPAEPRGGAAVPGKFAKSGGSWPSHNADLSNTRADFETAIDAGDVRKLRENWRFALPYTGLFGAFTSNPIVLGGVVYLEDPDSNVFALALSSGALIWKLAYHSETPSGGPNGVAFAEGLLFGETESSVFALDPKTGKQVWIRKLTDNGDEGIDMTPQVYGGKVLISTIPGSSTSFYHGGAYGIVYALNAKTGKILWRFSTVKGGAALWGEPKRNGGGGAWVPLGRRSEGTDLLRHREPLSVPPDAERPERAQPARAEPLHGLARRAGRSHRKVALVPAGDTARHP